MSEMEATTAQNEAAIGPHQEAIRAMMDAGVFYGRKKSRTHPRMRNFILHNRNGIGIINLYKTLEVLEEASKLLTAKSHEGGSVVIVATQPAFNDLVEKFGADHKVAYVCKRWLGGTLTNYQIISKRIEYYRQLKKNWETNAFEKYTKKERVGIERELNRLHEFFSGLDTVNKLPDLMIVIDPTLHAIAVREARQLKIPVIALTNVDSNPDLLDYPVVGNNKSRESVKWFLDQMTLAFNVKKPAAPAPVAAPAAAE